MKKKNNGWKNIKELVLQSIALIFINAIAIIHDAEFVSLAYVIDGIILGINIKALYRS